MQGLLCRQSGLVPCIVCLANNARATPSGKPAEPGMHITLVFVLAVLQ